jgi:small subunit ribosomal protein S16
LSVKIRLRRIGKPKHPFYRLVVADSRAPRDGKFIELLGTYDPLTEPITVKIDHEKVRDWLKKGARPSDVAKRLLVGQGVLPKEALPTRRHKPAPPKAEAKTEPKAEAKAEAKTEAKTEPKTKAEAKPEAKAPKPETKAKEG